MKCVCEGVFGIWYLSLLCSGGVGGGLVGALNATSEAQNTNCDSPPLFTRIEHNMILLLTIVHYVIYYHNNCIL